MPTTRPRYAVTDTGDVREMLDAAQRRWPDVSDRRQLLLRLAAEGWETIAADLRAENEVTRRSAQALALRRASDLVDGDALLADAAWR